MTQGVRNGFSWGRSISHSLPIEPASHALPMLFASRARRVSESAHLGCGLWWTFASIANGWDRSQNVSHFFMPLPEEAKGTKYNQVAVLNISSTSNMNPFHNFLVGLGRQIAKGVAVVGMQKGHPIVQRSPP